MDLIKTLIALPGFPFLHSKSLLNLAVEWFEDGALLPKYRPSRKVRSSGYFTCERERDREKERQRERERERDRVRESTHGIGITLPTFPSLLCISETSNSDRRQKEIEERVR